MRPEIAAAEWRNSNSIWENAGLDYWPHMVMIQLSFEFHKAADTRLRNATEPWLGVCVLKTQGVLCNLFLFCF